MSNVVTISYDSAGTSRNDHAARPHDRRVQRRPGAGLDQQRHLGQPGRRDPAGRGRLDRSPTRTATSPPSAPTGGASGPPAKSTDALGDTETFDYNANGLPTIVIDKLNRITQYTYNSQGNVTEEIYPDGTNEQVYLQQLTRSR